MTKPRIIARVFLVLLLALAIDGSPLFAQVKSSAITGTVTDQSGAVVPNATVSVLEQQTNTTTPARSDNAGTYSVPYLPIGHYTLTVTAPGFQTYRKTDINLAGATTVRADVPLIIGNAASTVEVKANALAIQTENATVSNAVSSDVIANQSNINGNSLYFATFESGVVGDPQQLSSQSLGVGYLDRRNMSGMRINGGEIGSNDVQLDGISIQGAAWHETAVLPNPDALSEVRVTTSNFTADVGLAQGVVSQTTKSGTNQFHGGLNFMIRNEDLNANSFSNNHQGIVRPKYRLLQGGGSIGGPVIIPKFYNGKDKLFFFASFLRLTHSSSNTFQATVPTALERVGNFSTTQVKGNSGAPVNVNIYNPFTATAYQGSTTQYVRQPYAGNIVTNPSQFGLKILQGYPMPNNAPNNLFPLSGGGGQDAYHTNNYRFDGISPEVRNSFNGRLDFKPSANQSIFFSAGISKGSIIVPNYWGKNANGPWVNQNGNGGNVIDKNPYGAIGDTIILNPTTVLDVRYGVTHINTQAQVLSALGDPSAYGQPGFVAAVAPFGPGNLPGINGIGSYTALNSNSYGNKQEHQLNHFVNGSLSKVKGNLTMKFGAEYRVYLQNYHDIQWQSPPLTTTNYTGQYGNADGTNVTALEPLNQDQGSAAASVVAGVEGWSMTPGTAPVLALASKYTAIFSQNSWRPTTKWLLSFGIRYEVQPGPTERTNRMASYILEKNSPFAVAAAGNPSGNLGYISFPGVDGNSRNLYETTWNNVAPRLGATYQLDNNTVLRGGFGRNYLPSNTGYNANTTIYNPLAFDNAVNPIPFGLAPNGLPAGTFDQGTNTYVIPGAGPVQAAANYGGNGGVTVFNRTQYKTGHTDQYNFFIERQLSPTWVTNIGYVGSRGGLLPWRGFLMNGPFSVNPSTLAAWRASWIASNGTTDPARARVPNPMPALIGKAGGDSGGATISAMESMEPYLDLLNDNSYISIGTSNYNALVLKVQHSTSHGLQFGANYTWSKATGNTGNSGTQTFAESQQGNSSGPTGGVDYYNIKNNHAIQDYDISNRFVLNGSYALPIGKGKAFYPGNTVVRDIIGDWQVTTAVVLQSGFPWGPNCAAQSNTNSGGTLNGRCVPVAGQPLELPKANQRYYNGVETLTLPDGRTITPANNTFMKWNPDAWSTPTVTFANGKSAQDQYS
ncbi:MAG: carboxypeptidase-like regulatory domain-containing protein, partial [Granulicella sp.]